MIRDSASQDERRSCFVSRGEKAVHALRRLADSCGRKNGAPEGIRTPDLCLRRAALYPAELRVLNLCMSRAWPAPACDLTGRGHGPLLRMCADVAGFISGLNHNRHPREASTPITVCGCFRAAGCRYNRRRRRPNVVVLRTTATVRRIHTCRSSAAFCW